MLMPFLQRIQDKLADIIDYMVAIIKPKLNSQISIRLQIMHPSVFIGA